VFELNRPNAVLGATGTSFTGRTSLTGTGGDLNVNAGSGSLVVEAGSGGDNGAVYVGVRSKRTNSIWKWYKH